MSDTIALTTLSDWYETEHGKQLYAYESTQIARFLPNCFGSELLQLGGAREIEWLNISPIKHKIYLNPETLIKPERSTVIAHPACLPFLPDSLDVILMPHTLECVDNPEALLLEASSALKSGGFMIILGMNRLSFWGMQYASQSKRATNAPFPWLQNFLSIHHIEKQLAENQCVIDSTHTVCYQMMGKNNAPLMSEHSLLDVIGPLLWPTFGGVYVILARKKINGWVMNSEKKVRYGFCETKVGWV